MQMYVNESAGKFLCALWFVHCSVVAVYMPWMGLALYKNTRSKMNMDFLATNILFVIERIYRIYSII